MANNFFQHRHAQELFFCDRNIRRTVNSNDLSFFGCDVQQKRNWEFMMYTPCYIGNGKIGKQQAIKCLTEQCTII